MSDKEVKENLKKLLVNEKDKLLVRWDCGGDQSPCWFESHQDKREGNEEFDDMGHRLIYRMMDVLELPNAGERYHKGSGGIRLNEKNQIVLLFDAKEHTYDYKKDGKLIELEDPANLRSLLHRTNIFIRTELNKEKKTQACIDINIIEGDEITIEEEKKKYYINFINDLAKKQAEIQDKNKKENEEWESIYIDANLTEEKETYFDIEVEVNFNTYFNQEEVVLID